MLRACLAALPLILLSGCDASPRAAPRAATPDSAPPAAGFPLTVTDSEGRKVTFPAPPQRIISLAPAHTETLYALRAGDRVVAADTYSDYPPEARPRATLNCWPHPPLERIVQLRPDLVVVLTQSRDEIRQLETMGIPVLKLFPQTYDAALDGILLLGRVTGTGPAAEKLVGSMRDRRRAVEERVRGAKPRRVLYELDAVTAGRPYVAGNGGFYGTLLTLAGGKNVFADVRAPSTQASVEQIVARDPEVILLGDTRSPSQPQSAALVKRRPGWGVIAAVRTGQIFPVNSDQITRPGPRLVEGLEEIARTLHPDRFR